MIQMLSFGYYLPVQKLPGSSLQTALFDELVARCWLCYCLLLGRAILKRPSGKSLAWLLPSLFTSL